jgi:MerR family transcriptional regulator, light-induced transcriptional regulator
MNTGIKLTSKDAARLLGVSEASIKRWADSGILPSEKTVGGHRRFRPDAIARFKREHNSTPISIGTPSLIKEREINFDLTSLDILEALIKGRVEEVSSLLINLYLQSHSLVSIFDDLVARTMRSIGDLWCKGEVTIAQEHIASHAALSALRNLNAAIPNRELNGSIAICGGLEDDFHDLPVYFTEILLESEGWTVINLGAHTPIFSIVETINNYSPKLICISSIFLTSLDRAAREYRELHKLAKRINALLVLGGTGFSNEDVRNRFPADLHAQNFKELIDFLKANNQ